MTNESLKAYSIKIVGIVQGVGFRPFIYRLAIKYGLKGYVVNLGGSEVEIHVEGPEKYLRIFLSKINEEKPPPAYIEKLSVNEIKPLGFSNFTIKKSEKRFSNISIIPPDIGICNDCLREIHDKNTRFYRYYWNSCAWCGPRFSMIYDLPYDRENTSMRKYPLCSACNKDYGDPKNIRRFHAQGISCPLCGPRTYVYNNKGELIKVNGDIAKWAAKIIEKGYFIAIKGIGGFHIASLASNDDVIKELRRRKERPTKPFALMARDCKKVEKIADTPYIACELLKSPERPIVILPKKMDGEGRPSELVAPGLDTLGIMLPYTGFQVLLLEEISDGFLIMTSGNRKGRPMCTTLICVLQELGDIIDYVIVHDREIVHRVDDSIIRFTDSEPVLIRRSRGYAPTWITVPQTLPEACAVGAELQVTGAVSLQNKIIPTQYIGDLNELGQIEDLEKELKFFIRVYRLRPSVIALDMHPGYHNRVLATKLASEFEAELVEVQHHHAHAASAMAEAGIKPGEKRMTITIDGTGFGLDGTIWGGEILKASYLSFERMASLYPFTLPGGERALLWPIRSLIGLMASAKYEEEFVIDLLKKRNLLNKLPYGEQEARIAYRLAQEIKPLTTSMGRTLDAFSALFGVGYYRDYEGEPAIKLEAYSKGGRDLGFTPRLILHDGRILIDTRELLQWSLERLEESNIKIADLSLTIQKALGRALGEATIKLIGRLEPEVFVSGGSAVNTYIIQGIREIISKHEISLRLQKKLPPGDGGISVGQIMVASAKLNRL